MPVACCGDIYYPPENHKVEAAQKTWVDSNYPYNYPDFEYVNLEQNMTQGDIDPKDITARVVENYNGWYTIEIYYKDKLIKTVTQ